MANDINKDHFNNQGYNYDFNILKSCFKKITFSKDDIIFDEKEESKDLYFIKKGQVDVLKKSKTGNEFSIACLSDGDFFGEMSFIDGSSRSAKMKAKNDVVLLVISEDDLIKNNISEDFLNSLKLSIAIEQNNRIKKSNDMLLKTIESEKRSLKDRISFSYFFLSIIISTFVIIFVNNFIATPDAMPFITQSSEFSWIYGVCIVLPMLIAIKKMDYSLETFGLSFKRPLHDVITGFKVGFTIVIIIASIYFMITKIFLSGSISNYFKIQWILLMPDQFIGYFIRAFLQQIALTGFILNTFILFFQDKKALFSAIMASSLFGIMHIHLGIQAVFVTFIGGIIACLIFKRYRSVITMSIIHAIVGWTTIFLGVLY